MAIYLYYGEETYLIENKKNKKGVWGISTRH